MNENFRYTFNKDVNKLNEEYFEWSEEEKSLKIGCINKETNEQFEYKSWIEDWFPVDDSMFFF